jgi:hypothetical protein
MLNSFNISNAAMEAITSSNKRYGSGESYNNDATHTPA